MLEANRENDVPSLYSNKSFTFDSVDDYIDCGTSLGDSQGTITAFSVSMWIKPSVTSGNDLFFNIGSFANSFGQIAFQLLSNKLYVKLNNGTRNYNISYTNTTAWQHLVFVYDGSNSANTKMYLDNVEQSPTIGGVFPSSLNLSGLKTIIGAGYSISYPYAGLLDEVSYFNTTLSSSDITSIFNQGVPTSLESFSPISHWRMGEDATWNGSQWTLNDNGSGGNNGTSQNMVLASRTNDVPLFNTKSILFDGVDDYVGCGNAPYLQNLTQFSFSLWAKQTTATTQKCFISDWIYNNNGNFAIQTSNVLGSATKLYFGIRELGGTPRVITTDNYPFIENVWNHIVVTFNSGTANIYVNGISESFTGATLPTSLAYGNGVLDIGRFNGLGRYFNGNIDEVAVFNTELSASQVTEIYNQGVPNDISTLNPLSWWRMGDFDSYPTLIDRGSGNNNGTMINMTNASIVDDVPE
jgi:hypothetical protein